MLDQFFAKCPKMGSGACSNKLHGAGGLRRRHPIHSHAALVGDARPAPAHFLIPVTIAVLPPAGKSASDHPDRQRRRASGADKNNPQLRSIAGMAFLSDPATGPA